MKISILRNLSLLVLSALALLPVCQAQSQIAGDWQGTLNAMGAQLRLVLHITAAKDGTLTSTGAPRRMVETTDSGTGRIRRSKLF